MVQDSIALALMAGGEDDYVCQFTDLLQEGERMRPYIYTGLSLFACRELYADTRVVGNMDTLIAVD